MRGPEQEELGSKRQTPARWLGLPAPDFTLENEAGEKWQLSAYRGKVVALLFYPKDETLVCRKQLCSVRDRWADYVGTGAEIVGVSPGTVAEHRQFAQKHQLPLHLLADTDGAVTRAYCVHEWLPRWATRAIAGIDAGGGRQRRVLLRAFRSNDAEVLTAIYMASYDLLTMENKRVKAHDDQA